ncbi:hypothetical protein HDU96_002344 [Phlyctochytrium bullatum]|nr:hypothetical protein HDU96_002344 [Phlyctochytrium bullatum]
MDESNKSNAERIRPKDGKKKAKGLHAVCLRIRRQPTLILSLLVELFGDYDPQGERIIKDPYYGGMDGFERNFAQVQRASEGFLKILCIPLARDGDTEALDECCGEPEALDGAVPTFVPGEAGGTNRSPLVMARGVGGIDESLPSAEIAETPDTDLGGETIDDGALEPDRDPGMDRVRRSRPDGAGDVDGELGVKPSTVIPSGN